MMWYILLRFLMADTECIADIIECLQFAVIAQAFPSEGWTFVIDCLSGFTANIDTIQSLSFQVASNPSPTPRNRFQRTVSHEVRVQRKSRDVTSVYDISNDQAYVFLILHFTNNCSMIGVARKRCPFVDASHIHCHSEGK